MTQVLVRRTPDQDAAPRERVAAQRAAARAALDELARRHGLPTGHWPQVEDGGRPLPVEGWHWSISHDDTFVAAVLSREPVGVDLERIAERRAALHDKVAREDERACFETWDALAFTRLWTAKEAVLKAAGVGMAELSGCRVIAEEGEVLLLSHRNQECRVLQARLGDHVVALFGPSIEQCSWDLPGSD